jgi:hypothetical protein
MAHVESITMSMREIDRLKTVQAVVDGNLKPMQAARRLEAARTPRRAHRDGNGAPVDVGCWAVGPTQAASH